MTAYVTCVAGGGRTLMPCLIDNHAHVLLSTASKAELLDETTMKLLSRKGVWLSLQALDAATRSPQTAHAEEEPEPYRGIGSML